MVTDAQRALQWVRDHADEYHIDPTFVLETEESLEYLMMTDEQRAANEALAERFGVGGYPTFVVLAPDGETVLGTMGVSRGMSFFGFVSQLERVLAGLECE